MGILDLVSQRNVRLLTTFGAILVGGVACPLIPALQGIELLQSVSEIGTGLAGNLFAGDLGAIINSLGQEDILSNNDLTKAVGLAVGLLLESIATSEQYRSFQKPLKKLAKAAPKKWLELAEANRNGEINIIDPIQEEELVNLFSQTHDDFFNQQPLTPADWESLLKDWLCPEVGITLPPDVITGVAQILTEKFPKALREVLKRDAEQGGKAFGGLMLSLLGQILATLRDHPQQAANLEPIQAGLAEIERLQKDHTEQFKQLGTEIESGFDAVLQQLGITQAQIQELRGWLSEELQTLQETMTAGFEQVSQQNQELKQIAEQGFETIIGFFERDQSKIQAISFSLNTTPPAVMYWQGRERDLAIVNGWLDDENNKLGVIVAIAGMGKSTLAAKVFNDRTDFVDKLWLDLSQRPLFSIVAQGILTQLGKLSPDRLKEIEETRLTEVLIHCLQQQRFLLVLDNLESVLQDEGYQNFLQHWLGKCYQTEILVTTQVVPNLVQDKPTELALEGLSATEGRQLLQNLDIGGTEAELGAFVVKVNGHPLTLRLVAGLLNDEIGIGATIEDLASLGIADVGELMGLQGSHREELVQLVAVLDASFNHLSEKLQRVLLSLVVLRWGFDGVTATAISGETVTEKELRELGKRGFLASETRGIYTFLPLILEYLKYRVGDLTGAHQKAIEFYQSRFKSRDQWQTVEDVREYLEVFYHWCELGEYKAAFDVIHDGSDSDNCVANFLNLRGNNQLLAELYQELVEHLTDKQDWRYTASLTSLGNAYHSLGRYEDAKSYFQQSLEIDQEIGDRGGEAASLCNLGNAYDSLGRYQEAISYFQQSLDIQPEIRNRLWEANSLNGLGNAYDSLGRYQEAISYYQQSLDIRREIGDRGEEAASLCNLGIAYNNLGHHEEAISYLQQSLEIQPKIRNRLWEANSLNGLGNAYNSLGRYEEAISYHQQSLEIQREIGNRRGEASSLNNLGAAYNSLGRYEEAISYHQQSLEIQREIGDRRGEANSLLVLGNLYQKIGRIKEGFAASQQAQLIYQELDLSIDAYPIPNWAKKIVKFAQHNKFNRILCFIIGVFAFPFALVGMILLMLYRIIRSRFPNR